LRAITRFQIISIDVPCFEFSTVSNWQSHVCTYWC